AELGRDDDLFELPTLLLLLLLLLLGLLRARTRLLRVSAKRRGKGNCNGQRERTHAREPTTRAIDVISQHSISPLKHVSANVGAAPRKPKGAEAAAHSGSHVTAPPA